MTPLWGAMADRFGRKAMVMRALAAFVARGPRPMTDVRLAT